MTPPPPRPSRKICRKVDYLKLNDGLEEPVFESPKAKRAKPYSPPLREGPSTTRQAAWKCRTECENDDVSMKLPDLVLNPTAFNGGTKTGKESDKQNQSTESQPQQNEDSMVNKVQEPIEPQETLNQALIKKSDPPACEINEPGTDTYSTPTQAQSQIESIGHDTCTTTDEEDAIEALLSLGDLPDNYSQHDELAENADLMPVGNTNPVTDVNPVPIKLSAKDVSQAIEDLLDETRFKPPSPPPQNDNTINDNTIAGADLPSMNSENIRVSRDKPTSTASTFCKVYSVRLHT